METLPVVISIIIIALFAIGFGVGAYMQDDDFLGSFFGGFLGAIIGLALVFIGGLITVSTDKYDEEHTLRALDVGTQVEGRASFLMGGYMNSSPSYRFMLSLEDENGVTYNELREVEADDVRIYETNEGEPRIVFHTRDTTGLIPFKSTIVDSYDVYIPEGSIVESTSVDITK